MRRTEAQKQWLDRHWPTYRCDIPWRKIDTKTASDALESLNQAKKRAREAVPGKEKLPEATEEKHCVVCMDRPPSHCYVPCGHKCICDVCSSHVVCQATCPLCKTPANPIRVFD